MTPTDGLIRFLSEQHPTPVGVPSPGEDAKIRARLALLAVQPAAHALFELMLEKQTSFCFFDLETYPSVLLRAPWKDGVATERELCVAKNGGGDLFLFDVDTGRVRLVVHDEGWVSKARGSSFDAFLRQLLWECLERIEPEDIEELDDASRARIRFATEVVGADALNDDAREQLVALGVVPAADAD